MLYKLHSSSQNVLFPLEDAVSADSPDDAWETLKNRFREARNKKRHLFAGEMLSLVEVDENGHVVNYLNKSFEVGP